MMLDPEARASIPGLRLQPFSEPDPSPSGHASFQRLLPTLTLCKSLRSINLGLYVSNIFRGDFDALKSYFLAGEPLLSLGLETLANTITSLPALTDVHLKFMSSHVLRHELDPDTERFLYFALSGMREMMLWMEIRQRLQANYVRGKEETRKFNGRTSVWINHPQWPMFDEGDDTMDFRAWVKWHNEKYPGGLHEGGVASIPFQEEQVDDGKGEGHDEGNKNYREEVGSDRANAPH